MLLTLWGIVVLFINAAPTLYAKQIVSNPSLQYVQRLPVDPYIKESEVMRKVARELSNSPLMVPTHHEGLHVPMPSGIILEEIINGIRQIIFPGYFGHTEIKTSTLEYFIGSMLDQIHAKLLKQIRRGFCFACDNDETHSCQECDSRAQSISVSILDKLPLIKEILHSDALAAYEGDPAAHNIGETIFCYPSMRAMISHRIAHELYVHGVPVIPRIISEQSHAQTGIDIHPGAKIGRSFFIDHGTGVVIGETCIIGENVRLYQGVTLGAKHFPLDQDGNPVKGIARHPIVEDDVVVYAGATILGRITIGKGAVIGGNTWVTYDVKAGETVFNDKK